MLTQGIFMDHVIGIIYLYNVSEVYMMKIVLSDMRSVLCDFRSALSIMGGALRSMGVLYVI